MALHKRDQPHSPLVFLGGWCTPAPVDSRDNAVRSPQQQSVTACEQHSRRLFLVPGAAGNPFGYAALTKYLDPDVALFGLQNPEFDNTTQSVESIEQLATSFVTELRRVQPSGPYFLVGHSFGGVVAYEMALQLMRLNQSIGLLAILDVPPNSTSPGRDEAQWLAEISDAVARFTATPVQLDLPKLQALDSEQRRRMFLDAIISAGILPPDSGLELVQSLLDVYASSDRLLAAYKPQPYADKITLIRCQAGESDDNSLTSTLGWESLSPCPIALHYVPGDHITMIAEPHLASLGQTLRDLLNQAS